MGPDLVAAKVGMVQIL